MRVLISGPRRWARKSKENSDKSLLVKSWIEAELDILSREAQSKREKLEVGTSLHLGLDTLFAHLAVDRDIPIHAILSCQDQDRFWDDKKREKFKSLLDLSSSIDQVCETYYKPGCIRQQTQALTEWMLEDDNPVLLLVKAKSLSVLQKERMNQIKKATNGRTKVFKW